MSRIVAIISIVMLVASVIVAVGHALLGWNAEALYRLLFVDFEGNLPTWFSSLLLLSCAAVLGTVAAATRERGNAEWRYWAVLAAIFVALSADEAASFHEMTVAPLRSLLGGNPWLRYPLIIPGGAAVAAAALMFRRFLRTWPVETRRSTYRSAALFLFGALVVETLGGWYDPLLHGESFTYIALATLEEGCEIWA